MGDRAGGDAALTRALDAAPNIAAPARIRATWALQAKRHAEAREQIRLALRFESGSVEGWRLLGAIEDALDHHDDAARAYRIALRLDRGKTELRQELAKVLVKQGKIEAAKANAGNGSATSEANIWHTIGNSELDRGRLGPAYDAYRKAVEVAPDYSAAWIGLSVALNRLGREAEAEKAFNRAVQLDPANVQARGNRASVRHALGQKSAAVQEARQLTVEFPESPHAWRVYGNIQMSERNYRDASVAFEKLDALGQSNPDDLVSLGESLAAVGQVHAGLAALRRAEEQSPRLVRMHLSMAKVLGRSGNRIKALEYLDRAIELEPTSVTAWSSKGYSLMRLGRLPEAINMLETAVRLDPNSANAWINLGHARMRGGDFGRAITALEKATALSPEATDARLYLAESYLRTRQPVKAREHANMLIAQHPDQPLALGILTIAHLIEQNPVAAAASYARLKATTPDMARAIKEEASRTGLPVSSLPN